MAEVIGRHPDPVAQFRAGKTNALGFLVGQVMKNSGGKANPKIVSDLMKKGTRRLSVRPVVHRFV